ncbi:hypothetical protein AMATHDRAFT_73982 [Amanita thiersii Skay4041]|uniref:assimilatory sulfite reductase (NADPH) n=1 Tax=Amanita thiersii Skay4041 TaxID=703135 RepID=A0A2A9NQN3_9AGAR|nr:hypothetical protein AMATHDRAFT_73982 [Amanita thiersii Skay4041]
MKIYHNPQLQISHIVEYISSRADTTSAVYIYDLAEQVGFGTLTKEWVTTDPASATVLNLQTRAGAGLSLVGRLSEGTSHETSKGAVLTAYTTPSGLAMMAASLAYLPPASITSRLIMQVPVVTPIGSTYSLSSTLASMAPVWSSISRDTVVLLSSTPQQIVDFAQLSYLLHRNHVIHLFDQQGTARELGHSVSSPPRKVLGKHTIARALEQFGYSLFDYTGDAGASTVIVLLNGPLALALVAFSHHLPSLGVIVVNVLHPWDSAAFEAKIPSSVTDIHVFDDVPNAGTQGYLYINTLETLYHEAPSVTIHTHRITPTLAHKFLNEQHRLFRYVRSLIPYASHEPQPLLSSNSKKLLLFNTPQSPLASIANALEELFLLNKNIDARLLTDYDILSRPGGVAANRLILSPNRDGCTFVPMNILLPFDGAVSGEADFTCILDHHLLNSLSLIHYAKRASSVLVNAPWTPDEFALNLPSEAIRLIHERALRLFTINLNELSDSISDVHSAITKKVLVYLAVLRLYLGPVATQDIILKIAQPRLRDLVGDSLLLTLSRIAWSALEEVDIQPNTATNDKHSNPLKSFEFNTITVDVDGLERVVNGARIGSWHDAAKHLLFSSAYTPPSEPTEGEYPQNPSLRPDLSDKTYLVTCTVNRRLTPMEYDRNVFHVEFDTTGTGLKYAIGEALGIHGWNDEQDILGFCDWYGVDPNRLITIPVPSSDSKMHARTIFQALQQQIDLFGKPPKSFYTELAPYATKDADRYALLFIGSPEGSSTFKKLSEKDTVTFADVLKKYPSARPGIERLCDLIGDIKPRHYSIASSQAAVGNRVDLLVVTVEWVTPEGNVRYGQCTRYLAGLRVGQKVTVSIKPSVMKLPPSPKQPLIMAGLGTGAAPFRAFLQYLAWLSERGEEIGPVYYYFGSRHQASEYLYGEELETYMLDGIITRAGLAFSRDQPRKVYIQHKMLEDAEELVKMLHDEKGVFYLCGPTWPVPDVYETLVQALVKYKGLSVDAAGQYLEGLKEEERYVLEVY